MCNQVGDLFSKSPKSFNYQHETSKQLTKNPYSQSTFTANPVSTVIFTVFFEGVSISVFLKARSHEPHKMQ